MSKTDIDGIIKARSGKYGPFLDNAVFAQVVKDHLRNTNWNNLDDDMKEALDLIALKISRILTGNEPDYLDNWDDISGYAKLVADRIRADKEPANEKNANPPGDQGTL
jgi:hypothetical protein